jgi:hypothetical protein
MRATKTIAIVMASSADPVRIGIVLFWRGQQ